MAHEKETFEPDDMVVWDTVDDPELQDEIEKLKTACGLGPFPVIRVEAVENLVHPQNVYIRIDEGEGGIPVPGALLKHQRH